MKYSVSIRQPNYVKEKADEVMVEYKDLGAVYDLLVEVPGKEIVVRISRTDAIEWKKLHELNKICDLTLAIESLTMISMCKGFKFYWAYPITTFYELNSILDLDVSQVLIGGPLCFDLAPIKKKEVPIRMVANVCYENYIPRKEGICGAYIRPEDVDEYGKYITTIEFKTDTLTREETLLELYQKKEWKGNLNLILTNLKYDVDNRGIPKEFASARVQCRQNCQRGGACHFCYTSMNFSRALDKAKDKKN